MTSLPRLCTARLRLQPLAGCDEDFYCAIYTNAELMQQIAAPLSEAAARRAFAAALRANDGDNPATAVWLLVERRGHAAIGLLGLLGSTRATEAEVGAVILPAWQGSGYAAEAIAALVDHAFSIPGLARLHTRHAAANAGAAGLMQKLDFACVACDEREPLGIRWELRRASWLLRQDRAGSDPISSAG
jgi:RimJ/RimL family protein N-acetyltransferase